MHVNAVLFDLFNTLFLIEDDEVFYPPSLRSLHNSLAKNGVNVSFEDFSRVYYRVRDELYEKTEGTLEEPHFSVRVAQTLLRLGYRQEPSDRIVTDATEGFANKMMEYVRLDDDAIQVLQTLRGKYKLGVVTNLAIPECVPKLFKQTNMNRFFDAVVISGAINRRKPSPEIFERALKALNTKAFEAVFVGDMLGFDVKGARNVGMRAILIERKTNDTPSSKPLVWSRPEWTAYVKPDATIRSLRELPLVLEDC